MLEEEPTPNIFKLVLCIDQVMLRRRQDLVLGHCKNENGKEENALGLHGASEQLLLTDHYFQLAIEDFQLLFKFRQSCPVYGFIKSKFRHKLDVGI